MSLEKKKIVVTGAASRIGAESAKVIKAQGATVMGDVEYNKDDVAFFKMTANQWWNGK